MTAPDDKPTLREQLDAVRPDSEDLAEEDLHEVAASIEQSDEWRILFERQQAIDREIATALKEVDVPDGLKTRLCESLAAARRDGASSDLPGDPPAPVTRRSALHWSAAAATLLLTGALGWVFWSPDGSRITLEFARHELLNTNAEGVITIAQLTAFDASFPFDLPDVEWKRRTIMAEELKGLDWTGDGRHDAAVYAFHIGGRVRGYLLVLPASRLLDPPSATHLSTIGVDYQPVTNTAWVDPTSGLVYICFIERGDLEAVQRALYPHSA